jgi:hypothetical protein
MRAFNEDVIGASRRKRMTISLEQALDLVVKGEKPDEDSQNVKLGKHKFYIRPLDGNRNLLKDGETSYFRHQHVGKDDRVFFAVKVKGKGSYDAKITRIEYRGLAQNPLIKAGMTAVDAAIGAGGMLQSNAGVVQKWRDGDWEKEAAKIVDAIGKRMAANGK